MARFWLRGCAFSLLNSRERHGLAFYRTEEDCVQREEQPMFVIPMGCDNADQIINGDLLAVIRCDKHYTSINANVSD